MVQALQVVVPLGLALAGVVRRADTLKEKKMRRESEVAGSMGSRFFFFCAAQTGEAYARSLLLAAHTPHTLHTHTHLGEVVPHGEAPVKG